MAKTGRLSAAIAAQSPTFPCQPAATCDPLTARVKGVSGTRPELFAEFIRGMNRSGIPYCLLSGYESYPFVIDSDVDFMVSPQDGLRIKPLLHEIANHCGGLLVQAIQHETSACYYVLAKQVADEVAYLHPDCTTDYRRNGRLWLAADEVIRNRRRFRTFFVPAVADEFQYYLIKKILKQHISDSGLRRIAALYLVRPAECCERLRRLWTKETTGRLVSALVRGDVGWMEHHLGNLLEELCRSVPCESHYLRSIHRFRDCHRRMNRAFHPTGLCARVSRGSSAQRSYLSAALERNLRSAFRRTKIIAEGQSGGVRAPVSVLLSKVRSTLVIREASTPARRWFTQDEVSFDLSDKGHPTVESATRMVLEAMANRLQRRIG